MPIFGHSCEMTKYGNWQDAKIGRHIARVNWHITKVNWHIAKVNWHVAKINWHVAKGISQGISQLIFALNTPLGKIPN